MRIILLFLALLLINCTTTVRKDQLTKINGYWEIEKVIMADGAEKDYKMNTTVDYFMLDDMEGYRKKVQPLLDGSFDTSDDAQAFKIYQENESFLIQYKNELSEWFETIATLNESKLILVNEEGISYYYKKFKPLTIAVE